MTTLLRSAGWSVNRNRVERIWRREGLKVPQRQPKRGRLWLNDGSCIRLRPEYQGHVWAYDFVEGRTHDSRKFRILTIIDEAIRPHSSLGYRPPAPEAGPSPVPPSGSATLHLRPALVMEVTMH